jgi:lysine-specific demethylase 8
MSSPDMFTTVNALIEHLQSKVERKAFIYKAPSRIAYARITQSQQRMHRLCAGNLIDHGTGYSLCSVIESRASPDILSFYSQYFVREQPVVLTGCMEDWPAMLPRNDDATSHRAHTKGRWADLDYLLSVLGSRTVPVETGRSYLSEDSGSSFLTGEEFIRKYIVGESAQPSPSLPEQKSGRDCTESGKHSSHISQAGDVEGGNEIAEEEETELPMGYLAQHQLLEQVPALQRDVVVPDYCALLLEIDEEASTRRGGGASSAATSAAPAEDAGGGADPSEVIMQAWLGPVGTVSPLHHDPYYNLLAQTAGTPFSVLPLCPVCTQRKCAH